MIATIAASVGGAALSYWGELQRKKEEENALKAQEARLTEAKIDSSEEEAIKAGINREFNTVGTSEANRAAFGAGAVLNKDVIRGLGASRLLGERAKALTSADQNILSRNSEIEAQIAGLGEAGPVDVGNIVLGGLSGFSIGESIEKSGGTDEAILDFFSGSSDAPSLDIAGNVGLNEMLDFNPEEAIGSLHGPSDSPEFGSFDQVGFDSSNRPNATRVPVPTIDIPAILNKLPNTDLERNRSSRHSISYPDYDPRSKFNLDDIGESESSFYNPNDVNQVDRLRKIAQPFTNSF